MAVLLSTAEGVPLGRVYADLATPLSEEVLSSIESTWAPASKQFPLLGLGKEARIVTAIFDHGKRYSSQMWKPMSVCLGCSKLMFCFLLGNRKGPYFMCIKLLW